MILFCVDFESRTGLKTGTIVSTIVRAGGNGVWAQMERGEFPATELSTKLSQEIMEKVPILMSVIQYIPKTHFSHQQIIQYRLVN